MFVQLGINQITFQVLILEEEQYRRMVDAYRAELQNVSEWLGRKRQESHSDVSSTSSDMIHKQLKKCKHTVSDIERKLKLLGELSSKLVVHEIYCMPDCMYGASSGYIRMNFLKPIENYFVGDF